MLVQGGVQRDETDDEHKRGTEDQGAAVWRVVHKVCDDSGEVWSRSDGRGLGVW